MRLAARRVTEPAAPVPAAEYAPTRIGWWSARAGAVSNSVRGQLAAKTAEAIGFREAMQQRVEEIEHWKAALADHASRLDEVHRSRTWRWTSPARAVFRLLGGS